MALFNLSLVFPLDHFFFFCLLPPDGLAFCDGAFLVSACFLGPMLTEWDGLLNISDYM